MDTKDLWVLDGGMGRELARRGAPFRQPEWSALALMEAPETVREVHQAYAASGARVITTNSYALVPFHIGAERFAAEGERLAALAGQLAREVADEQGRRAGGRLSATAVWLLPRRSVSGRTGERAGDPAYSGALPHVDLWLAETMSLIAEPLALKALLPGDGKPFWVSFTLEDEAPGSEPTLRSGERVADAVTALASAGVDAILFNCCQPEVIEGALKVAGAALQALGAPTFASAPMPTPSRPSPRKPPPTTAWTRSAAIWGRWITLAGPSAGAVPGLPSSAAAAA